MPESSLMPTSTNTPAHAELAKEIISRQIGASSPAVSPDHKNLADVVTQIDYKGNKFRSQVWLAATNGYTAPRPLTASEICDGNPRWSPDSTCLEFTSGRSETKDRNNSVHHSNRSDRQNSNHNIETCRVESIK